MNIFRSFGEAASIRNPVVTTGSFDGVHIGHKTILNRLNMLAEKYDGESVLITFDPHPRKVLYPETAGKDLRLINSQEEKLELLRKAGLANVIIIEFTREFSRITSEQYVGSTCMGFSGRRLWWQDSITTSDLTRRAITGNSGKCAKDMVSRLRRYLNRKWNMKL